MVVGSGASLGTTGSGTIAATTATTATNLAATTQCNPATTGLATGISANGTAQCSTNGAALTGVDFTAYRAGGATISASSSSVTVTFSSAMANTNYRVTVQITSATAFMTQRATQDCPRTQGPDDAYGCFFLRVTSKTTTGFTLELRRPLTGSLKTADAAIDFDYIAMPNK